MDGVSALDWQSLCTGAQHQTGNSILECKQEQGIDTDFRDAQGLQGADNDLGDEEDPFDVGYNHYEVADRTVVCSKNTKTRTPKESSTPASATKVDAVYAVVDKSKKKGAKKKGIQE